ncbi:MAG: hypothetical protein F6K42_22635 [Leptolyngbya sp. SIO1D8]|nr:hypothetical protein [Leptolyngbya sp. SIO1D8]
MWIHRLTALAIVILSSTVLRTNVIPTLDQFLAPQEVTTSMTLGVDLKPIFHTQNRYLKEVSMKVAERPISVAERPVSES